MIIGRLLWVVGVVMVGMSDPVICFGAMFMIVGWTHLRNEYRNVERG